MLLVATRVAQKVQGNKTFDPGTRSEKKLVSIEKVYVHTLYQNLKNICYKMTTKAPI